MELDPDKERWRQVAKDWFARGLAITPNSGKLQHHLELLCCESDPRQGRVGRGASWGISLHKKVRRF